jgi:hypothetical protein
MSTTAGLTDRRTGTDDSGITQRAPAAWHTACTLLGLKSFGSVAPHPEQVDRAYTWLRSQQTDTGCWSPEHLDITCYTTKQVIAALAISGYETNHRAAERGTDWFIKQCTSDGPLAVRLMAGFAVARTRTSSMSCPGRRWDGKTWTSSGPLAATPLIS